MASNPILEFLEADGKRTQGPITVDHDEEEGILTVWLGNAAEEGRSNCYPTDSEIVISDCNFGENYTELKQVVNANFFAASSRIAAPLIELIADYKKALEDLHTANSYLLSADAQDNEYKAQRLLGSAQNTIRRAINAAEKHRDLLDGVTNGK